MRPSLPRVPACLGCLALLGCASGARQPPDAAATAAAQGLPSNAAKERAVAAAGDDAPCAADADCGFTLFAPGACCPLLCAPRPVTRQGAAAAERHAKSCSLASACPEPSCRPPRETVYPACERGRCVAKALPSGPQ